MKPSSSHRIVKATFEATSSSQELLRLKLDELIKGNRPIKDEQERAEFMQLISHSLLGLGADYKVRIKWCDVVKDFPELDPDHKLGVSVNFNLDQILRAASYFKSTLVPARTFENQELDIPISWFWRQLQINCFAVFPRALQVSLSMSKEKDEQPRTEGYTIE